MRTGTASSVLVYAVVAATALGAGGCGGSDEPERRQAAEPTPATTEPAEPAERSTKARGGALSRRPSGEEGLRVPARRARIVARRSTFGRVLFDANGQVVYVFENDRPNRSNCTSEDCVEAWPPVLTRQPPSAGDGVDARLLGTIRRRDGRLQVTYNGRPLYFYEHEGPGEIRCHNVTLHGGLWWVVTPRGGPAD
jgi:predicted lipoprotein with Yx(FWY)xxD motif